jgi:hypothetical protein
MQRQCALIAVLTVPAALWAGTHTAASPSFADVSSAVASASSGDTVRVPAGTAVWNNQLVITKGIKLMGAGIDSTVITSDYSNNQSNTTNGFLIVYAPDSSNRTVGFRLSGFDLDFANKCHGVVVANMSTTPAINVRIDHNSFVNAVNLSFNIKGHVFGVADNNIFHGSDDDMIDDFGLDSKSWKELSFKFGSAENFYYEDNTTYNTIGDTYDCSFGGRYVIRFNTINNTTDATGFSPAINFHGTTNADQYSAMGGEIYCNTINGGDHGGNMLSQRGGKMVAFNNNWVGRLGSYYATVGDYGSNATNGCDYLTSVPVNVISGQPQYPSDSYYFNNTLNGALSYSYTIMNQVGYGVGCSVGGLVTACCPSLPVGPGRNVPMEDIDVWFHKASFNGTSGVGVGLYASMPTTCTPGVAYWATDKGGNWNTVNETADDGALYKCTATNTWELYYKPYTYPHPLRFSDSDPNTAISESRGSMHAPRAAIRLYSAGFAVTLPAPIGATELNIIDLTGKVMYHAMLRSMPRKADVVYECVWRAAPGTYIAIVKEMSRGGIAAAAATRFIVVR